MLKIHPAVKDDQQEIVQKTQVVGAQAMPVELSSGLLQALATGDQSGIEQYNPVGSFLSGLDEPRGNAIAMVVKGAIERVKTGTQTRNIRARRHLLEEKTATMQSAIHHLSVMDEFAIAFLKSGTITPLQRTVLTTLYPKAALQVQKEQELELLKYDVEIAELQKQKRELGLDEADATIDTKERYTEGLNQRREEQVMALQSHTQTMVELLQTKTAIEAQVEGATHLTPEQKQVVKDELNRYMSQLQLENHGNGHVA